MEVTGTPVRLYRRVPGDEALMRPNGWEREAIAESQAAHRRRVIRAAGLPIDSGTIRDDELLTAYERLREQGDMA